MIGPWGASSAVQLAQPPVPFAKVTGGVLGALAKPLTSGLPAPATTTATVVYLSGVPVGMSLDALGSPGARAAPPETDDGHQEVASDTEPPPRPEAIDPFTPFDVHGPGAAGGSGGGVSGTVASFRYVAIAPTPIRVGFPQAFIHAPAPSSAPEGALEDAPTTRPG